MIDNQIPTYRSNSTGELYLGQSRCMRDQNGFFEGFSTQGEPFIPINPETNEPYFHSVFEENDAVWVAQKVTPTPNSEFGGDEQCKMIKL